MCVSRLSVQVYVQDRMNEESSLLNELLFQQPGNVYVCGSRALPKAVQSVLRSVASEKAGLGDSDVEQWVVDMHTSGRYNVETW